MDIIKPLLPSLLGATAVCQFMLSTNHQRGESHLHMSVWFRAANYLLPIESDTVRL